MQLSFHIEILQAKQQEALQQQLEGKRSRIAQDFDEDKAQEQSWGCWFGPLCAFNYDWYAVPSVQQEALQQQLEGKRSRIAQDSDEDKAQEQSWGCWFGPLCAFNYDWYAVPSVQQEALQNQA